MPTDVIIIGQGLAGTALAWTLLRDGRRVLVIDDQAPGSASRAAAGLYNPITGPRMVLSWNAHRFFPYLEPFYRSLEQALGIGLLHPLPIYRPFASVEQQNDWAGKSGDEHFRPFVLRCETASRANGEVRDPLGGLGIGTGGYLDLPALLPAFRRYLEQQGSLLAESYRPGELRIGAQGAEYGGHKAEFIIFCTGYRLPPGGWFDWLPLRPVKGETLLLHTGRDLQTIYNKGCFIIPLGEGRCRAGSTYTRGDLDPAPTEGGRQELEAEIKSLYIPDFGVVGQEAGIRPATPDRRPLLGMHPKIARMGVFTGLGSRGVSMAPLLAGMLAGHLFGGAGIEADVNINRFISLYFDPDSEQVAVC
jgi:glycine oxidase